MLVHILTPAGMTVKPIHEASAVHAALTASISSAEQLVSWQGSNLKHLVSGNVSHVIPAGTGAAVDLPAGQSTQSDAALEPSTENEPAGQTMQAVPPTTSEYFPGSQFAQTVAGSESASDFPAGQLTQAAVAPVITVAETEPAVQAPENGVHSVDASVSE